MPVATLPPPHARPTPVPDRDRPEVFLDTSAVPETGGATRLWYRLAAAKATAPQTPRAHASLEQVGWRSVVIPATVQPFQLRRLALLSDHRLIGATGNYGDMFTFDPSTARHEVLGSTADTNVYGLLVSGGKLYYSGYPGAPLCVYDPARPWTLGKDTPLAKAPDWASRSSNPRRLVSLMERFEVHYGYHIVRDAEGRLYVGCHAERNRVGGALAVYDPATEQTTGVGDPELTQFDCAGLAAASGGRLIVYSSSVMRDPTHPDAMAPEAKLIVYDPAAGRFTREITPLPGRTSTGLLATGAPGQVVGASPTSQGNGTTLYAVDVATGKLVWQHDVSGSVPGRVHEGGFFQRGPDGQIWTFLNRVLVRIRPETGEVTPVGAVASGPGDAVFIGRDLYLAGTTTLRRIRGVVPPHAQKRAPLFRGGQGPTGRGGRRAGHVLRSVEAGRPPGACDPSATTVGTAAVVSR
jgi:outer membrane protein assembly factor BamB